MALAGKLAHASASLYTPLHGLWEVWVSGPSHTNPTSSKDQGNGVNIDKCDKGSPFWEIVYKLLFCGL